MAGPLQKTLQNRWQELLGVEAVGLDDNFFDLGGNSLLMIRLHAGLQSAFGDSIPIVEMFQNPTVRMLGQWLEAHGHSQEIPHVLQSRSPVSTRADANAESRQSIEERARQQLAVRQRARERAGR